MFVDYLRAEGYTVHVASSGAEAIRKLQTRKADVAFIDILMPDKDGIETLLEIRKFRLARRIHVISGGGRTHSADFLEAAVKLGADGMLKKPFAPSDMVKC